jgi:hypothetical protein
MTNPYNADDWKSPFHFFSSDTKLSDADCDTKMSQIFGGFAQAMEANGDLKGPGSGRFGTGHTAIEKNDAPRYFKDTNEKTGVDYMKENKDRVGIIHNYTNSRGTRD